MPRVKKQLFTLSVLFSFGFMLLGFFAYGTFSWTTQHVSRSLKAAPRADASVVKQHSPAESGSRVDLKTYDQPTPRSEKFLTAGENADVSLGSFTIVPPHCRVTLAPKVSRYIAKSVLNI